MRGKIKSNRSWHLNLDNSDSGRRGWSDHEWLERGVRGAARYATVPLYFGFSDLPLL